MKEQKLNYRQIFSEVDTLVAARWRDYEQKHSIPKNKNLGLVLGYSINDKHNFISYAIDAPHNSRFRIGQNTMSFTAAAVLYLEQNNWLHIESPLVGYIPTTAQQFIPNEPAYAIPFKNGITIESVLRHESGIFDLKWNDIPKSLYQPYAGQNYYNYYFKNFGSDYHFTFDEQMAVVSSNYIADFLPYSRVKISHTGYTLMAKMIDRVSGYRYERFIAINFFGSQGLYFTSCPMHSYDTIPQKPYTKGYSIEQTSIVKDVSAQNVSWAIGSANFISSPYDIIRWNRNYILGKTNLSKSETAKIKKLSILPVSGSATPGIGVFYFDGLGWGNFGLIDGYTSLVIYNQELDVSLCLYFNFSDNRSPESLQAQKDELLEIAKTIFETIRTKI